MKNQTYINIINETPIKRPIIRNAWRSFLTGGIVAFIGQGFYTYYYKYLLLSQENAQLLMAMTLVFITSILTGCGIFDYIGNFAGAGTFLPITGFANSTSSAALESKSEGLILGILSNTFKLSGAIIVTGVISSLFFGIIIYFFRR